MPAGRPPKPTALKKLAGNPGKRALPENEPKPGALETFRAPRWLPGDAKKEWRRVVKELDRLGLVTTLDRAALEAYCVLYARWVEAEKVVQEKGTVVKTTKGNLIQNPFLAVANRARVDMLAALREFGMTPSARSKVSAAVADQDEPSLAEQLFILSSGGEL